VHVQRLVSVVKIVTALEQYTTEEQSSVVLSLWAKGRNAKNVHKEIFPVYGLKCLSSKAVHNWVEKLSQGRSKFADDARPGAEVSETVKNSYAAGFDALVKRWDKCNNVGGGYVEKCFPRFEYHVCYILYPFMAYLLTHPRDSVYSTLYLFRAYFCVIFMWYTQLIT
jgi:hypothetical protein